MNRKLVGILICMLLTTTSILPVVGIMNKEKQIMDKNLIFLENHDLEIEWERFYGDSEDDLFRNVKQTSDGGYILVGVKDGQSHWLLKVDANGDIEWSQTTLPNLDLWPRCYIVEETSDGGFVTAGCHEDGIAWGYDRCIWKVDQNGDTEFCKIYDDPELGYHTCIQETSDEGFIVTGEINYNDSTVDWDVLLMKTDSTGNLEWQKTFRYGEYGDNAYAVKQTFDGGYILSGRKGNSLSEADFLIIKTDSEGNKEWDKTYGGNKWDWSQSNDILLCNDGGFIFLAETDSFGAGSRDFWLIKTDSTGNMLWNKTFGGKRHDMSGGMDFTDDGGIIITGTLDATYQWPPKSEGLLIKTDENGNILWEKTFGYERADQLQSVCSTSDQGYIVGGLIDTTEDIGVGEYDAWLIKIKQFDNTPPEKPDTPSGDERGKPNEEHSFTTSSSDVEEDTILYMWDWGDGNYSEWLETNKASHNWTTEDKFEIRVIAKDIHGGKSDWSDPFIFSTPKNKVSVYPMLIALFEKLIFRFPFMGKILNQII